MQLLHIGHETRQETHLLLRCTGVLQGSPWNLLWFKGAIGGRLLTAISHGRIGDVVGTSHTQEQQNNGAWGTWVSEPQIVFTLGTE